MERMRQAGQKWRREDPLVALTTSPTGRDDPVDEIVRRPEAGALEPDGAPSAVRNDLLDKLVLAQNAKFLDGADLTVEIGEAAPVGAGECERPLRGTDGEGRVATRTPKHVHLPWDKPTEEVVGNNADFCCHDGPFLLVQPECCLAGCAARVRCISDTHETRSRLPSENILFASQDLISCLPACQSALSDKDLLDLSMKADIYISHMDAYVNRFRQFY